MARRDTARTEQSGTVFSVPVSGGTPAVLVSFSGSNGANPTATLTLSGTTVYGTTAGGGASGDGVVFSLPIRGGTPKILASFSGSNGEYPYGALTPSGQTLYGTTEGGGAYGDGAVFSLPAAGGAPTVLASFNGSNGRYPYGGLTLVGSTLYGTTESGGAYGYGVVFSLPLSGGTPTALASFKGSDGANPYAGLVLVNTTLYGTTASGGVSWSGSFAGCGTVFALDLGTMADTWTGSGGGSWNNPSNWTSGLVPTEVGAQAVFAASAATSSTITLDGNQTVGSLTFSNTAASYTLAAGEGGTLTLNNSGGTSGSRLLVFAGSHAITAPVTIAGGSLTVSESNHSSLAVFGIIDDDNRKESLMLTGDGTGQLVLSGTNTYGGTTMVEHGTLLVTEAYALPSRTKLAVGAGGRFVFDPSVRPAPAMVTNAAVAVPEPSTLLLLAIGLICARIATIGAKAFAALHY